MAKYTDNLGVERELLVTVKTLQLVKKERQFDLAKLLYPGSRELERVTEDPILMCELCYLISEHRKPANERTKIEEFYDGLAGDALDQAMEAMLDAIADFYPRPEQRAFLRDLKTKAKGVTAKVFKEAQSKLEKLELTPTTMETTKPAEINSPSDSSSMANSPTSPSEPSSSASNSPPLSDSAPANSAS